METRMLVKIFQVVTLAVIGLAIVLNTAEGCDYYITFSPYVVTTPNYPNSYPRLQKCYWKFVTDSNKRIKLVFTDFSLERTSYCQNDYVKIYDGLYEHSNNLLGTFCLGIPPPIISKSNKMLMVFKSDLILNYSGFRVIQTAGSNASFIYGADATSRNLTQYYLRTIRSQTNSIQKWGTHVAKSAVALFLNDREFFAPGNNIGEEIAYELTLQLFSKLVFKKKIQTEDLALYINALTVACIDPRDFFGINLVDELRNRVTNDNRTNPFSILTLCNAKDIMTADDVLKLQQLYSTPFTPVQATEDIQYWFAQNTRAMVLMALSCISSSIYSNVTVEERILVEMASFLKATQFEDDTVVNLKTTSLIVQALLATKEYRNNFNLVEVIELIMKEVRRDYPSIQDMYYLLPIFNSMSLANIGSDHCKTLIKPELDVKNNSHELSDQPIQVQVSVIIGNNKDFSRTWKVEVPSDSSFYQVLKKIGTLEPAYNFLYGFSHGKPYIVGLSKFQYDAEDGFFWFIYTKPLSLTESPKFIEDSPVDIQVKETEELILWYRSETWKTTHEETSN